MRVAPRHVRCAPEVHVTTSRWPGTNSERLLEYTQSTDRGKHSPAYLDFLLCKPGSSNPPENPLRACNHFCLIAVSSYQQTLLTKKGSIFQTSRDSQYSWQTSWPTSWARFLPPVPRQPLWWRPTQPSPLSSSAYLRFYSSPIAYTLRFYRSYAPLYGGPSIGS